SESMMALFALSLAYCTLRGAQSRHGWGWYVAATTCGWLGFASREPMVVVPIVLLMYDRIMIGQSWDDWLRKRGWLYTLLLIPLGLALYQSRDVILDRLHWKSAPPPATIAAIVPDKATKAERTARTPSATLPEPDEFEAGTPPRATSW